jgi:hypothetical protein
MYNSGVSTWYTLPTMSMNQGTLVLHFDLDVSLVLGHWLLLKLVCLAQLRFNANSEVARPALVFPWI